MTIYVDPEGNASISTDDFNFSAQEEVEAGEQSETSEAFETDEEA